MRNSLLWGFILALMAGILVACGGSDGDSGGGGGGGSAAATATTAPTATSPAAVVPATGSLQDIAAKLAGGPGAFYLGDLNQLVGPAPMPDLGDADGFVPLKEIEANNWIFKTDYYNGLIERAKFTDPTPTTTAGAGFKFQFACINRALTHCKLAEWYADNVSDRTNGQLEIEIVGYPELGIAGPDLLELLANGTLSIAELPAAYTAGDMPALEMKYLWGLFKDHRTHYDATTAAIPDLDRLVAERTGGGVTILQLWRVPENDIFFFTKDPINSLDDLKDLKVRSFGGALSDLIDGMGAKAQWVAFAEVYTALERGILNGAVTGANAGYGQRWYEVTDYITGPIPNFTVENMTVNPKVWESLPADFQQILLEEGAKYELEFMRIGPILAATGVPKLEEQGMTFNQFSPEVRKYMFEEVALKKVVANWVKRAGGPESEAVKLFNDKVGPVAGVRVNPDGTVENLNP